MTEVTVTDSLAALRCTASHRSSATRIVRVGVLGALGIRLVYTERLSKNWFKLDKVKSIPPSVFMPSPSITAFATAFLC